MAHLSPGHMLESPGEPLKYIVSAPSPPRESDTIVLGARVQDGGCLKHQDFLTASWVGLEHRVTNCLEMPGTMGGSIAMKLSTIKLGMSQSFLVA